MKMNCRRTLRGLTIAALSLTALLVQPRLRAEPDTLSQPEYYKLAEWRYEALHGDRTHIADIIAALHNPHITYVISALQAVTQLNAVEALPDIEAVMQTYPPTSYYHLRAKAVAARLQANTDVPTAAASVSLRTAKQTPAQTHIQAKTANFLNRLGLTPQQVGARTASFVQNKARLAQESPVGYAELPPETVAMQEIADMIYHEPGVTADVRKMFPDLDFTLDFSADLKIKLAPFSHSQRIAWLVNDLAQTKIATGDTSYEVQLAIDEGIDASNAAAAKLKQMDVQRAKYSTQGFTALFEVLDGIGDKAQLPLLDHFLADRDGAIRHYASASAHGCVASGHKYQYLIGY